MTNDKYELFLDELSGVKMFRIRAKAAFGNVAEGEMGGYIESERNLSPVGGAWVSGNALVSGNARVAGNARVTGNARVSGNALVSGNARVTGNALVFGNAWVSEHAEVSGNAWVSEHARVSGEARVTGNALVFGNAWVSEHAEVSGNAKVGGDARLARPSDILVIGPAGSRDDYLTVTVSNGKARIGCFAGTLDELEAAAKERQRQDYLDLLPGIRAMINRRCNA